MIIEPEITKKQLIGGITLARRPPSPIPSRASLPQHPARTPYSFPASQPRINSRPQTIIGIGRPLPTLPPPTPFSTRLPSRFARKKPRKTIIGIGSPFPHSVPHPTRFTTSLPSPVPHTNSNTFQRVSPLLAANEFAAVRHSPGPAEPLTVPLACRMWYDVIGRHGNGTHPDADVHPLGIVPRVRTGRRDWLSIHHQGGFHEH